LSAGEGDGVSDEDEPVGASGEGTADRYECIPIDQLADILNEGSAIGLIPDGCGDARIENTEQCDDGNNIAGDGCSENCVLEDGPSCSDPSAITFKKFEPTNQAAANNSDSEPDSEATTTVEIVEECPLTCEPNNICRKIPGTDADGALPQSPNYLGPFVGGVLRNVPAGQEEDCPNGWSPIEVEFAGQTSTSELTSALRCIPTELCGDFEAAREFFFGEDYNAGKSSDDIKEALTAIDTATVSSVILKQMIAADPTVETLRPILAEEVTDEAIETIIEYEADVEAMNEILNQRQAAAAIEAMVCINVEEIQRPESPYPLNDACVDCHILGMIDIMEEMLSKNVAPLENPKNAWALSNRWGPSVKFDINVTILPNINNIFPKPVVDVPSQEAADRVAKALKQEYERKLITEQEVAQATAVTNKSATEILQGYLSQNAEAKAGIALGLKNYRATSEPEVTDKATYGAIHPMLIQMLNSFKRLQDKYAGLSLATKFATKKECKF
jgi:cysteine-rich repeat protein